MKLEIKLQDRYSRGELLLRTFFGWIYICIPHFFILFFVSIWSAILKLIAFFAVLFTARYPKSIFEFHLGLFRWNLRIVARLYNVADGYPAFGIKSTDDHTTLEAEYPEKLSRGLLILRILFGFFYVLIPHGFILFFRGIATGILIFLGWWAVLFTAKYPASFHSFITGTIRWSTRVNLYMGYMTDVYPPFTGK
jgi:hypothetical protein